MLLQYTVNLKTIYESYFFATLQKPKDQIYHLTDIAKLWRLKSFQNRFAKSYISQTFNDILRIANSLR
jgi:hypothetical protein